MTKSSGESEGTEVTIPVPLVMEMVDIGRAYTKSYLAKGALSFFPIISSPITFARQGHSLSTLVSS